MIRSNASGAEFSLPDRAGFQNGRRVCMTGGLSFPQGCPTQRGYRGLITPQGLSTLSRESGSLFSSLTIYCLAIMAECRPILSHRRPYNGRATDQIADLYCPLTSSAMPPVAAIFTLSHATLPRLSCDKIGSALMTTHSSADLYCRAVCFTHVAPAEDRLKQFIPPSLQHL